MLLKLFLSLLTLNRIRLLLILLQNQDGLLIRIDNELRVKKQKLFQEIEDIQSDSREHILQRLACR